MNASVYHVYTKILKIIGLLFIQSVSATHFKISRGNIEYTLTSRTHIAMLSQNSSDKELEGDF